MSKVKSVGIPAAVVAARDAMDAVDSMRSVLGAQATEVATLFAKARTAEGVDTELRTLIIAVDRRLQAVAAEINQHRADQRVWNAQSAEVSIAHGDRLNAVSESADRAHTYALTADAFAAYMAQKVLAFTSSLTFLGRLRWLCTGRVDGMPTSLAVARGRVDGMPTTLAVARGLAPSAAPRNRVEGNQASRISPAPVYGAESAGFAASAKQRLRHAGDPCEPTAGPMMAHTSRRYAEPGHVW